MRALITLALILTASVAYGNCKDDLKSFKQAEKFGAFNFTCEDNYDGRTTSSWRLSTEDFKKYREYLKQSKRRSKK